MLKPLGTLGGEGHCKSKSEERGKGVKTREIGVEL